VTDYSKMNYQELFRIANNDPAAEAMSEEEYEALSVELWRKFSAEKRIGTVLNRPVLTPTRPNRSMFSSFLSTLRKGSVRQNTSDTASQGASTPPPQQQPSFFRSGD
jgi:hypothetical protein